MAESSCGFDEQVGRTAEGALPFFGERGEFDKIPQHTEADAPGEYAVFDVVDGVRNVVGGIHDLGFHADTRRHRRTIQYPIKYVLVFNISPVFRALHPIGTNFRPGVFAGCSERGAGEVEPEGFSLVGDDFGFEAAEYSQGLGVAFEAAALVGKRVQGYFPVVPVGRVPDVVAECREFGEVGVNADAAADATRNLGDFEGVRESCSRGVAVAGTDDLGFVGEAS